MQVGWVNKQVCHLHLLAAQVKQAPSRIMQNCAEALS